LNCIVNHHTTTFIFSKHYPIQPFPDFYNAPLHTTLLRSNSCKERYCHHFKIAENKFCIPHKNIAWKPWKRRSHTRLRTPAGRHLVVSEAQSAQTLTGIQTQTQAEGERMIMTIDLDEGDSTLPSSSRPHTYYPKLFLS
jgi:hypothetical protein